MKNKNFSVFTLASNGAPVAIALDNIAFAMRVNDRNDKGEDIGYTRVYMRSLLIDDDAKWIDIKETPDKIG